jgi:hypothetical protein
MYAAIVATRVRYRAVNQDERLVLVEKYTFEFYDHIVIKKEKKEVKNEVNFTIRNRKTFQEEILCN